MKIVCSLKCVQLCISMQWKHEGCNCYSYNYDVRLYWSVLSDGQHFLMIVNISFLFYHLLFLIPNTQQYWKACSIHRDRNLDSGLNPAAFTSVASEKAEISFKAASTKWQVCITPHDRLRTERGARTSCVPETSRVKRTNILETIKMCPSHWNAAILRKTNILCCDKNAGLIPRNRMGERTLDCFPWSFDKLKGNERNSSSAPCIDHTK